MNGRFYCFVIVLQMVSWVCVTSRTLAPYDGPDVHQGTDQSSQSSQFTLSSKEVNKSMVVMAKLNEAASFKEVNKIGSSPPRCEHKCFGCSPCEATQVPTTTSHVGVQYANYEPEGWKCKCGPTFYSP